MIDIVSGCSPSPVLRPASVTPSTASLTPSGASVTPSGALDDAGAAPPVKAADLSTLTAEIRALAKSPPIDAARVVALRSALQSGDYAADPQAIASAMLELDRGSRG